MTAVRVRIARGGGLLKDIKSRIGQAKEVLLASAYVSPAGIEELLPSIRKLLSSGGSIEIYATFDGTAATRPEAFKQLVGLQQAHAQRVGLFLYPNGNSLFHAKAFLFRGKKGGWSGIIGSANLTSAALTGKNVELAADCQPLPDAEVKTVRSEISRLRTSGLFMEVTPQTLPRILSAFGVPDDAQPTSSTERFRQQQRRAEKEKRLERLLMAPPEKLPPLAPLDVGGRAFVEELAAGGVGVGLSSELDDVHLSFQLEPFVRAGVVLKQKKETVGGIGVITTKQGQGIALVPEEVRDAVSAASRSLGAAVGATAVDLGFARWVPRVLVPRLVGELAESKHVREAKGVVRADAPIVRKHLEKVRAEFSQVVGQIVERLPIELDPKKWAREKSEEVSRWPRTLSEAQVRTKLHEYIERTYLSRVSDEFVRSKLLRLSFEPSLYDFPLQRIVGTDADFGHRHFLASVVWALADPLMKKGDGGRGRGAVFQYLDARFRLNLSRHKFDRKNREREVLEHFSAQAAAWMSPGGDLENAVDGFRALFGDAPWAWDTTDLA